MLIKIQIEGEFTPLDIWENYPTIPNIGERIGGYSKIPLVVTRRTFYKDEVVLTVSVYK